MNGLTIKDYIAAFVWAWIASFICVAGAGVILGILISLTWAIIGT